MASNSKVEIGIPPPPTDGERHTEVRTEIQMINLEFAINDEMYFDVQIENSV